jgi:hypothetical protein
MVTIQCSRLRALFTLFVWVPLLTVLALVIPYAIANTPLAAKGIKELAIIYLVGSLSVIVFSLLVSSMVRNRESLFTTFEISPPGITIKNSRYGALLLNWSDLTRATYSRGDGMITLESPQLLKPIAIMDLGGPRLSTPEFTTAQQIIQGAIHDRWIERLI